MATSDARGIEMLNDTTMDPPDIASVPGKSASAAPSAAAFADLGVVRDEATWTLGEACGLLDGVVDLFDASTGRHADVARDYHGSSRELARLFTSLLMNAMEDAELGERAGVSVHEEGERIVVVFRGGDPESSEAPGERPVTALFSLARTRRGGKRASRSRARSSSRSRSRGRDSAA